MKQESKTNAIVLLSGGIDSAACIRYYLDRGFCVKGLFIDYGQLAGVRERSSASKVASYYDIELDQATFSTPHRCGPGEIRGRNAFLVTSALLFYPQLAGIVALGIHTGATYYDCSESFVTDIQAIVDQYAHGEVRIDTPFLEWDKPMIYAYCKEKDVPLHLTYSCEAGTVPPCGRCLSCKDRVVLDVG